jgi:four helix bundle protein
MKVGHSNFEQLRVYRLAEKLADQVWGVVATWPFFAKDTLGKQLVRAADSIGANIAEGVGRRSFVENRRFIRTARGSLNETRHWLRRAHRRDLLTKEGVNEIKPLIDELTLKLNAYLRSIGELIERSQELTPPASKEASQSYATNTNNDLRTTNC